MQISLFVNVNLIYFTIRSFRAFLPIAVRVYSLSICFLKRFLQVESCSMFLLYDINSLTIIDITFARILRRFLKTTNCKCRYRR